MRKICLACLVMKLFIISSLNGHAQSLEEKVIQGPKNKSKQIVEIVKQYELSIDSLQKENINPRDTFHFEGLVGTIIDKELNELEKVLKTFLEVKIVISIFKRWDLLNSQWTYSVSFDNYSNQRSKVIWTIPANFR